MQHLRFSSAEKLDLSINLSIRCPLCAKSGLMHCSKRRAWVSLSEHPISTGEQRRWHLEAERLRSLEVDD